MLRKAAPVSICQSCDYIYMVFSLLNASKMAVAEAGITTKHQWQQQIIPRGTKEYDGISAEEISQ